MFANKRHRAYRRGVCALGCGCGCVRSGQCGRANAQRRVVSRAAVAPVYGPRAMRTPQPIMDRQAAEGRYVRWAARVRGVSARCLRASCPRLLRPYHMCVLDVCRGIKHGGVRCIVSGCEFFGAGPRRCAACAPLEAPMRDDAGGFTDSSSRWTEGGSAAAVTFRGYWTQCVWWPGPGAISVPAGTWARRSAVPGGGGVLARAWYVTNDL